MLLTIEQVRKRLGIGKSHIYKYIRSGELASCKLGKSRRVSVAALEEFVKGLSEEVQS